MDTLEKQPKDSADEGLEMYEWYKTVHPTIDTVRSNVHILCLLQEYILQGNEMPDENVLNNFNIYFDKDTSDHPFALWLGRQ